MAAMLLMTRPLPLPVTFTERVDVGGAKTAMALWSVFMNRLHVSGPAAHAPRQPAKTWPRPAAGLSEAVVPPTSSRSHGSAAVQMALPGVTVTVPAPLA